MLLSAVLSAVLLAGLWWITDQTIRDSFAASTREGVDVDLTGLVDIYASGGQAELEQRIADRLAMVPIDAGRAHWRAGPISIRRSPKAERLRSAAARRPMPARR